jgi:CubicO group peptidase (beta-lactamase class C family)
MGKKSKAKARSKDKGKSKTKATSEAKAKSKNKKSAKRGGKVASGSTAFPPNPRVDKIFARWDKPDSPGFALAVAQAGKIVYARGYGMADLDHNIAITPYTVFHACSLSKQFTAMAIMLLVGEKKLKLSDHVHTLVPELKRAAAAPIPPIPHGSSCTPLKPVTIGQMLHHISGRAGGMAAVRGCDQPERCCRRPGAADEDAQFRTRQRLFLQQHQLHAGRRNRSPCLRRVAGKVLSDTDIQQAGNDEHDHRRNPWSDRQQSRLWLQRKIPKIRDDNAEL